MVHVVETLTLKQIYDEIANLDILDIKVPVERDGKDLVVTPEILAMFKPDDTGRLHPIVDSLGRVTESHGASIDASGTITATETTATVVALNQQPIIKNLMVSMAGSFEGGVNTETDAWRFQHKFINIPLQCDGAGELAPVNIVSALGGFRSCMRVWGIWSDKTDGSVQLAFSTGSGLTTGPALLDIATTAYKVTDYAPGILWEGSAVADAIVIAAAAGQGQADQKLLLLGDWWHELV